jgi:hypothetical protein
MSLEFSVQCSTFVIFMGGSHSLNFGLVEIYKIRFE